jgi:hypothetical protein
MRVRVDPAAAPPNGIIGYPAVIPAPRTADPVDLPTPEMPGASGSIDVLADLSSLRRRFPHFVDVAQPTGAAELVSLTRLVGMHVPGLHSLFSSFDVELGPNDGAPDGLRYAVARYDERFAKTTVDVSGRMLRGTVVAFVRPQPVEPTIGEARPRPHEFAGQRWLVVGGSRGLGATTALLARVGGGDVRLTYRIGADDAERLAASIGASARRLDVADPGPGMASILADGWHPTHLAYFASPPIFVGAGGAYSAQLEKRFDDVYIGGFEAILDHLDVDRLQGVLWPSSEAVDHDVPGLAEYATVKRRGEVRCERFARQHGRLTLATPRLPRLRTDQTASFVPVDYDDAATTLLHVLRAFSG